MHSESPQHDPKTPLLKRLDQAAIAGLLVLCLVGMGAYWVAQGGLTGRLIEIDRAPREPVAFTLDVNEADWPELSQLPGIGETLARRIVESREAEGPFADIESLDRVRGIGPRTLERIRPYVRPLAPARETAGK